MSEELRSLWFTDEAGPCLKNGTGTPKYHSSVPGRQYATTVRKKRNPAVTERNTNGSFATVAAAVVRPAFGSSVIGLPDDSRGAVDDCGSSSASSPCISCSSTWVYPSPARPDRDWGVLGVSDIVASVKELADEIEIFFNDWGRGIVASASLASNNNKKEEGR